MHKDEKTSELQTMKKLNMKIVDIIDEIEEAKTYRFITAENEAMFKYTPGQAVKLYFDTPIKKNDFRLYSIASSPLRTDYLELTIKSEGGNFAPYFLAHAKIKDVYVVEGPFGRFLSKPLEMIKSKMIDKLVFLASSSGIVPFRCFIEYAIDSSLDADIYLFYVNRTRNDIIYRKLIPKLLSSYKKLKIMFNLTREHQVAEDDVAGQLMIDYENYHDRVYFLLGRRLEFEDIKNAVEGWNEAYYAICGGARFITGHQEKGELGMMQKLEMGGIDRKRIEIDSYGTK